MISAAHGYLDRLQHLAEDEEVGTIVIGVC